MLQKFREMVNIMLDTSQMFGIISHTEQAVLLKRCQIEGTRFYFIRHREALSHPQNAPPGSSESALRYDSQFFATIRIYPNLPESLPRQS